MRNGFAIGADPEDPLQMKENVKKKLQTFWG
jgi:hypothetical protein